ncbi:MAG: hypothetical protein ACK5NK_15305 [Niabella sp.]
MKKIIFIGIIGILTFSCKKKTDKYPTIPDYHIYAVGDNTIDGILRPIYYKDSVLTVLPNDATRHVSASKIFVQGNDVYIVGYRNRDNSIVFRPDKALLWKNGIMQILETPTGMWSIATDIVVLNNNVYISGTTYTGVNGITKATIWKNGQAQYWSDDLSVAELHSLFIDGEDIYACGFEKVNGNDKAKYWKNGVGIELPCNAPYSRC